MSLVYYRLLLLTVHGVYNTWQCCIEECIMRNNTLGTNCVLTTKIIP